MNGSNTAGEVASKPTLDLYRLLGLIAPTAPGAGDAATDTPTHARNRDGVPAATRRKDPRQIAGCYWLLAKLPDQIFERVGYYEARLWRQALQTLMTLEAMRGSYSKFKQNRLSDAAPHRNPFSERVAT